MNAIYIIIVVAAATITTATIIIIIIIIIHSFIQALQVKLLRGTPNTAQIPRRSFTPKRHRQLRAKDLPKVPTWRLEQESNSRPFGRYVSTLPMSYHAPLLSFLFIIITTTIIILIILLFIIVGTVLQ